MNRPLVIAWNDLRLFLREKSSYFWLFGTPFLFAFFMGFANRGPGNPSNPRPPIVIENVDEGFLGKVLIEELGVQGLRVETNSAASRAERSLRVPRQLTEQMLQKKPVKLELSQTKSSRPEAGMMVEMKLVRAVVALNSYLLEHGNETPITEDKLRQLQKKPNPVQLRASFGTRKPIPSGSQQSVPGVLVMFIMMNLLIFGGATLASDRREGILRRLLAQPLASRELVLGKIIGLLLLGCVQIAVLLGAGKLIMGMNFAGNLGWVLIVVLVYSWVAGALGILIGSLITREDKVIALCVLCAMLMAALGGSWWPLEIVPDNIRLAGHLFPTAWTMDALHQLLSFGGGFKEIRAELAVLLGYGVAATV